MAKALSGGSKGKGSEHGVRRVIWELTPKEKTQLPICLKGSMDGLNSCQIWGFQSRLWTLFPACFIKTGENTRSPQLIKLSNFWAACVQRRALFLLVLGFWTDTHPLFFFSFYDVESNDIQWNKMQTCFKAKWSTLPLILFQPWCQKLQIPWAPFRGFIRLSSSAHDMLQPRASKLNIIMSEHWNYPPFPYGACGQ